jgi:hypothetical protein
MLLETLATTGEGQRQAVSERDKGSGAHYGVDTAHADTRREDAERAAPDAYDSIPRGGSSGHLLDERRKECLADGRDPGQMADVIPRAEDGRWDMDGSSLSLVIIPVVVVMSLAAWLIAVAHAAAHPEWKHSLASPQDASTTPLPGVGVSLPPTKIPCPVRQPTEVNPTVTARHTGH